MNRIKQRWPTVLLVCSVALAGCATRSQALGPGHALARETAASAPHQPALVEVFEVPPARLIPAVISTARSIEREHLVIVAAHHQMLCAHQIARPVQCVRAEGDGVVIEPLQIGARQLVNLHAALGKVAEAVVQALHQVGHCAAEVHADPASRNSPLWLLLHLLFL